MRWRCVECGRPHETAGGTCDCGSEEFERLVVQVSKRCTTCGATVPEDTTTCPECGFSGFETLAGEDAPDDQRSYIEWRCGACGREHPKHTPPCSRCGHETLERHRVEGEDVAVADVVAEESEGGSIRGWLRRVVGVGGVQADEPGPSGGSYVEWRCQSCDRAHPKNNPPCSRCGHETLERHRVDAADVTVEETPDGYGVDDSLVAGFDWTTVAGVGIVVVVVVLIWAFVPGAALPGTGGPWVDSVNRTALESELVAGVNGERTRQGGDALARSAALAGAADELAADAAAGERPVVSRATDCKGADAVYRRIDGSGEWPGGSEPTEGRVADRLLNDIFADDTATATLTAANLAEIGAGTAVDGQNRLHVVVVVC